MAIERQRSVLAQEQQALQEKAQEICRAGAESLPQWKTELAQARQAVQDANDQLAERAALQEEERRILDEQTEALAENKRLKDQMNEFKARLDQLEKLGFSRLSAVRPTPG